MTPPAEFDAESAYFSSEQGLESADWSVTPAEAADSAHQINDRRARLESAETLRLARAL